MCDYNIKTQKMIDFTTEENKRKTKEMALFLEEIVLMAEEIEKKAEEMDLSFEEIIITLVKQKANALFEEG